MARGPQKTTRLVRGGPLVTIILSNRTITTHNNGQYKTHYRYSRKSKTFVLNDCNVKIEVTEFGKEFVLILYFVNNNMFLIIMYLLNLLPGISWTLRSLGRLCAVPCCHGDDDVLPSFWKAIRQSWVISQISHWSSYNEGQGWKLGIWAWIPGDRKVCTYY